MSSQALREPHHPPEGATQRVAPLASPTWAGKFLDAWCTTALRSRIEPMKKIARMCRRHRPLILNWFKAKGRISNGVVEGLNTKAKLTIRKSALPHKVWVVGVANRGF